MHRVLSALALAVSLAAPLAAAERLGKPGSGSAGLGARASRSFPEDVFGHPAHSFDFSGRPLSNHTVAKLLEDDKTSSLQIIRGPSDQTYLCTMPTAPNQPAAVPRELSSTELVHERTRALSSGLSLLEPLKGQCLYHTLDWFTYAFCHGDAVRQFHALSGSTQSGREPVPDPNEDSYVLGRFNPRAVQQQEAATKNEQQQHLEGELMEVVSFSVNDVDNDGNQRAERYVSQIWGGGTLCDISNEPRTVEVQYHCSRRPGDRISLVKETTTCNYVLIIDTPRLCKEPAFAQEEEVVHAVQCRRILSSWEQPAAPVRSSVTARAELDAAAATAAARDARDERTGFHTRGDGFTLATAVTQAVKESAALLLEEDGPLPPLPEDEAGSAAYLDDEAFIESLTPEELDELVREDYDLDYDWIQSNRDPQPTEAAPPPPPTPQQPVQAQPQAHAHAAAGRQADPLVQQLQDRLQRALDEAAQLAQAEDAGADGPRDTVARLKLLQDTLADVLARQGGQQQPAANGAELRAAVLRAAQDAIAGIGGAAAAKPGDAQKAAAAAAAQPGHLERAPESLADRAARHWRLKEEREEAEAKKTKQEQKKPAASKHDEL